MCESEGMVMAAWATLGGGLFKTDEQFDETKGEGRKMAQPSGQSHKISAALNKVAKAKGTAITSIALRNVMHKSPHVFPICGGRKIEHLQGNIQALAINLTDEEIDEIDAALPFDVGFPMSMLFEMGGEKYNTRMTSKDLLLVHTTSNIATVQKAREPKAHN
ncbi:MAG: hypothetical protein Q9209_005015 [Squamulea sp. 1 TL-2023]